MYLDFWHFQEKPFENTPDPKFFYPSAQHASALQKLIYAINEQKGCALFTGEYGCGKTVLVRSALERINLDNYELALINYPMFTGYDLLSEILVQFGMEGVGDNRSKLFRDMANVSYNNIVNNKNNLVIIDEAQVIEDKSVFEELRLLLNLQLEDRFLITLVLVGQPELRDKIMEYPQLEQRISVKFHLHRFDLDDTIRYVRHRLQVAGGTQEVFAEDALYLIHKMSFGVPRRINNVADMCLLEGFNHRVQKIDEEIVKLVI